MKYDTALREQARQKILEIGPVGIVVGIPTYNSEQTIAHVIRTVMEGLETYYPGLPTALFISDGGSLDYTREVAEGIQVAKPVSKIVTIYRGVPGKGTSLRAIFEAAVRFQAKACIVLDSDLRSITPAWVPALLRPVLEHRFDFVSPYYIRHKGDATITNNIARALTQALYGKRIRQPIGGDFGFSARLANWFIQADVWDTDVARFGVDIWMTTVAICEGFSICEAPLGTKIHDPKDPGASLGPMFRQVVGTLFSLMGRYERIWRRVRASQPVPLLGEIDPGEPPPVEISLDRLIGNYRAGFKHFGALWREVLARPQFAVLKSLARADESAFAMDPHDWARMVYELTSSYHRWSRDKYKLVEIMTPIYYARVAAFVLASKDMSTAEAEKQIEHQADVFELEKPYLLKRMAAWEELPPTMEPL
ncbi:MAG: glycosyltransferase [Thermoguttaceae bacterium]